MEAVEFVFAVHRPAKILEDVRQKKDIENEIEIVILLHVLDVEAFPGRLGTLVIFH